MSNDLTDSQKRELRRHDLKVGVIVWLIAVAAFVESWDLTFGLNLPGVDAHKAWLVAPGVFPLVLSASLILMLSFIIWISLKEGRTDGLISKSNTIAFFQKPENKSHLIQVSLLLLYVFGLLGNIPFALATIIYLFLSMYAAKAGRWYIVLAIAVLFSLLITYLFGSVMDVPLP